ncbi:MAG: endolytic transglycosylase MltG [Actinomycetota bacterium]|nr:endolytic transglycosylase MltG [Actinomycetota bacterium]
MHDYPEYESRLAKRRAISRERKRRKITFLVSFFLIIVIVPFFFWLGWHYLKPEEKRPLKTYRVVVPEGLDTRQTARKVASQCEITYDEFMAATNDDYSKKSFLKGSNGTLEGFLFPKTYDVDSKTTAKGLILRMLDQFETETSPLDWSKASSMGMSKYQILTIASLIEKEAKFSDERPIISSVVYNRIKKNMKLQIDATVQYSLGEWKPSLTYDDLKVDSPYNTYLYSGLPPGPICNPGIDSIRSALNPAQTDYIYYIVTSSEGRHSFTADYQQFLNWKKSKSG